MSQGSAQLKTRCLCSRNNTIPFVLQRVFSFTGKAPLNNVFFKSKVKTVCFLPLLTQDDLKDSHSVPCRGRRDLSIAGKECNASLEKHGHFPKLRAIGNLLWEGEALQPPKTILLKSNKRNGEETPVRSDLSNKELIQVVLIHRFQQPKYRTDNVFFLPVTRHLSSLWRSV